MILNLSAIESLEFSLRDQQQVNLFKRYLHTEQKSEPDSLCKYLIRYESNRVFMKSTT